MEKKGKVILSIIGLSAVIVPALLLIFFTSKTKNESLTPAGRQIDSQVIDDAVKKLPLPNQIQTSPSPGPATSSAQPILESSPSSQ